MSDVTKYDEYMKDEEFARLMMQEDLIMSVTENICGILEEKDINRTTLANKMNKTKGYISQILNGGRNITLRTLSDFAYHLGCSVEISFKPKQMESKKIIYSFKVFYDKKKRFKTSDKIKGEYASGCPRLEKRMAS